LGKGIATKALAEYVGVVKTRPLFAHVAKHNVGSQRVLEKCGFTVIGEDTYVNIGKEEVEEFVLKLNQTKDRYSMTTLRQLIGRFKLQWRGKNHIVGWSMKPNEAISFFKRQEKTVVTFFGYSINYKDEESMLKIVRDVLSQYSPETTLVNIGATMGGLGAAYPLAKSMGFITTGIVSTEALAYLDDISDSVDRVCFIQDKQWGGKLPDSNELSPTSKAMVACSDILIAIGGNDIARDELLEGKEQGKLIQYFPAEMNHEWAISRAERMGLPPPKSFLGSVHDVFGK